MPLETSALNYDGSKGFYRDGNIDNVFSLEIRKIILRQMETLEKLEEVRQLSGGGGGEHQSP